MDVEFKKTLNNEEDNEVNESNSGFDGSERCHDHELYVLMALV